MDNNRENGQSRRPLPGGLTGLDLFLMNMIPHSLTRWDLFHLGILSTVATTLWNENKELKTENEKLKTENEKLKTENEKLKTENENLKKDNADLEKKYQIACFSNRRTLEKLEEQKKIIEELKQKLSAQSNESKISTQNEKNNKPSLLGKIESLKGNLKYDLKICRAAEHSYTGNNKNHQTK